MAATVLFNATLAANATTAPLIYTVATPGATVAVEAVGTFPSVSDVGFVVAYAVSIDSGVTYSAYTPVMEIMPLLPTNGDTRTILPTTKDVDHVAFIIQNRNQANALTNVKLQASG